VVFDEPMDIRACTDDDLEALLSRWPTSVRVHEAHFAQQLAGRTTYLVAWRGGDPLGSGVVQWGGCIGPNAQKAFPDAIEINHLHVRGEFRGQGVGTGLINAAEELVRQGGGHQSGLSVADDNTDAERLHLRLGYRPTGVFDVCEYDWITDEGVTQHEIERSQLLVKGLGEHRPAALELLHEGTSES
jgi:GNAT superfamily N-acetyltransferase